jgi:hypothetical protein
VAIHPQVSGGFVLPVAGKISEGFLTAYFEYDDAAMAEASEEQYFAYLEAEEERRQEGLG